MKILFLSHATQPDYQADMVLHGLKSLYGDDVVDYSRVDYLYKSYGDTSGLYGRGFSLYGLLPDDSGCDRKELFTKMMDGYFDLVVYGSIQRCRLWWSKVAEKYTKHKIIAVDGEDQQHFLGGMHQHCLYFKREMALEHPGIFPIHFAIPQEKIGTLKPLMKTKMMATVDPRDRKTYIFDKEKDYYRDYAESMFAITMMKGGWDCLRHYEIMANGCLPVFLNLKDCPKTTMHLLPKGELLEAVDIWEKHPEASYWSTDEGHNVWLSLWRRTHLKFARYFTTLALAQYIIETSERNQ